MAVMESEIRLEIYRTVARVLFPEEGLSFLEEADERVLRGRRVTQQESLGEVGLAIRAATHGAQSRQYQQPPQR